MKPNPTADNRACNAPRPALCARTHIAAVGTLVLALSVLAPGSDAGMESGAASGSPRTLTLDPAASRVSFTLGATLHTVKGEARLTEGEIRFDPSAGTATGRIVIDATSLVTHDEKRDRTMHAEVLESAEYPRIVFEATGIEGKFTEDGESEIRLVGTFSIHGEPHDFVLPARVSASNGRVTGACEFSVPYVEWGMKNPSVFVLRVKKVVEVSVEIEGRLGTAE
jgi:polyisoprenoid-binding protein YceI